MSTDDARKSLSNSFVRLVAYIWINSVRVNPNTIDILKIMGTEERVKNEIVNAVEAIIFVIWKPRKILCKSE